MKKFALVLSILGLACSCGGGGGGGGPSTPPAISVSLAPAGKTSIDQGQTVNFTATVANDSGSKGVTWSVSGTACSGAACGSLTNTTATTATYNAPSPVSASLTVSVTATSAADATKSASSTVVVNPPPSITTTSLPSGTMGTTYSAALAATGGTGTLTWSVAGGSLPANLSLSSSGAISGTPAASGTSTFTVAVTDSAPTPLSAQQQLSITISPAPLKITTTSLPNGVVGVGYSASVVASGGTTPYTWSVTLGTLPAGLSPDSSTGVISGTPTATGTSNFTVTVTDSSTPTAQTASRQLSITITAAAAACTSSGNESILSGQYVFTLSGYNGTGFLAVAGAFTGDGTGKITAGEADTNGVLGYKSGPINTTASSYSVGSDNRGCATIVTSFGTFITRFALGSLSSGVATRGRIIEFDPASSTAYIAAGQIVQQDPTSFSTGLSGNYAFSGVGEEPMPARFAVAGVLPASGGTFSSGEEDVNDAGSAVHLTGLTGTYSSIDTSGRVTATVVAPSMSVTSHLAAYMVSTSEIVFVTADDPGTNPVLSGEMRKQSGTLSMSSLNGTAVFYFSGVTGSGSGSEVTIGTFTANGSGSATVTAYDDYAGSLNSGSFPCGYTVAPNGRTTLSGSQCGTGAPVLYLTAANTGFILGMEVSVQSGQFDAQTAGPFSNASVSGTFFMGTDAVVGQGTSTEVGSVSDDGAGNASGINDATSTTSQDPDHSFTDTYTVNSDGTFTTGSGTAGFVISDTKFVTFDQIGSTYPTMAAGNK